MTPRLSVALIVKNEEKLLARSLASLKGRVDEIVCVDTGSTDATVSIATEAGCRVVHWPWREDFAAARNFASSQCTGDWILTWDADFVVATPETTWRDIRAVMREPKVSCASLWVHNAKSLKGNAARVAKGHGREGKPFALALLFRNVEPERLYEGIIHENPANWVLRRKAEGMHTVSLPGSNVVHYGYDPAHFRAADKGARNMRLLTLAVEREPENPIPLSYLALIYAEHETVAEGAEVTEANEYQRHLSMTPAESLQRAADMLNTIWPMRARLEGVHLLRACVARCKVGFRMMGMGVELEGGERGVDLMWDTTRVWDREGPQEHPDMLLFKGLCCEMLADMDTTESEAAAHRAAAKVFYTRSLEVPYGAMRFVTSETAEERLQMMESAR